MAKRLRDLEAHEKPREKLLNNLKDIMTKTLYLLPLIFASLLLGACAPGALTEQQRLDFAEIAEDFERYQSDPFNPQWGDAQKAKDGTEEFNGQKDLIFLRDAGKKFGLIIKDGGSGKMLGMEYYVVDSDENKVQASPQEANHARLVYMRNGAKRWIEKNSRERIFQGDDSGYEMKAHLSRDLEDLVHSVRMGEGEWDFLELQLSVYLWRRYGIVLGADANLDKKIRVLDTDSVWTKKVQIMLPADDESELFLTHEIEYDALTGNMYLTIIDGDEQKREKIKDQ